MSLEALIITTETTECLGENLKEDNQNLSEDLKVLSRENRSEIMKDREETSLLAKIIKTF